MVIVIEWEAFWALDLLRIKELRKAPVIVDLRTIYRPQDMKRRGFKFTNIGS
jgi:UDPglucose 6-dehydrogenase